VLECSFETIEAAIEWAQNNREKWATPLEEEQDRAFVADYSDYHYWYFADIGREYFDALDGGQREQEGD
jgi:hypothetical protein